MELNRMGIKVALIGCLIIGARTQAAQPPDVVTSDDALNLAAGPSALLNLTDGEDNTAVGFATLRALTTGSDNTALGAFALSSNNGDANTAVGSQTLANNSSGNYNAALGRAALQLNTTGYNNVAVGFYALYNNTTGHQNGAMGYEALLSNTTGSNNIANGANSLRSNTTGGSNIGLGVATLQNTTIGQNNLAIGANALNRNVSGSSNTAIGAYAGFNISGRNNIDIANQGQSSDVGTIRIGDASTQTETYIAGIVNSKVTGGAAVYVSSTGQLGVMPSAERYKVAIQPMSPSLNKLGELRPVTYRLKSDPQGALQYGLIAEEVARVYPDMVYRNESGGIEGVRYEQLTPILLHEVQQHRKEALRQRLEAQQQRQDVRRLAREFASLQQRVADLTVAMGDPVSMRAAIGAGVTDARIVQTRQ